MADESEDKQPDQEPVQPVASETPPSVDQYTPKKKKRFRRLRQFLATKKGKFIAILLVLLVTSGILYAIPSTRYGILGQFIKRDANFVVMDSVTKKPVTQASVTIAGLEAKTDNKGKVTVNNVPVGEYTATVKKKNYEDQTKSYNVPIFGNTSELTVELKALGRQVGISVVNLITKAPIVKAELTVGEASVITDSEGKATIVLPTDQPTQKGVLKLDGYNESEVQITVTDQPDMNKLTMTPAGSVFYLSKATGKINVMKSNLDGTGAKTVVEATGSESDSETVLLAARDWKYMALFAKRDASKKGELFLVNAATGKLSVIDEGITATFQAVGWSNHRFLYLVDRDKQPWEDKQRALKSFDADTGKTVVLDETQGYGTANNHYQREYLLGSYVIGDTVVYAKAWSSIGYGSMASKKSTIVSMKVDGSQKQTLKEFTAENYINIDARAYEPKTVAYNVNIDSNPSIYYEYKDGKVEPMSSNSDKFYAQYPTYLVSPGSDMTLWSEPRNGKTAVLVGDDEAKSSKTLANESDYSAYGWYGDQYVLVSKNGSELYIASKDGTFDAAAPLKITNYHKPALTYPGYGYGYGGI